MCIRDSTLIDRSFPHENAPTRKPRLGLVQPLLRDHGIDWARSAMVGDRETDIEFAVNLGIRGFKLKSPQFGGGVDWAEIAHVLADVPRTAKVVRRTKAVSYTHLDVYKRQPSSTSVRESPNCCCGVSTV